MTATRIARAGRIRFFIGLGVLVITMGFVAMFHSSQQQLDESRRMEIRCEQQQEAMILQIADLENKLKTERQQSHQTKLNLEREAREQTDLKEKSVQEINLKLSSLQQHYKLLKSQHEDFVDECSKEKAKQLKEVNELQSKVKLLESKNDHTDKQRDKDIYLWKAKYNQLLAEKQILEKSLIKNIDAKLIHQMKQEIDDYKSHCTWRPVQKIVGPTPLPENKTSTKSSVEKNFSAQIAVSDNLYKIPIKYANNTDKTMGNGINKKHGDGLSTSLQSNTKQTSIAVNTFNTNAIINSVENFQLVPKPLVDSFAEAPAQPSASTTNSSLRKTSESADGLNVNVGPNALLPEQSRASSTMVASKKMEEYKQNKHVKLPNGVVPFQSNLDDMSARGLDTREENLSKPQTNNRYSNIVAESNDENENAKGNDINDSLKDLQNGDGNNDMGAREVNDSNDFVVDEHNHHGHLQDTFDHKDEAGDAAEDLNVYKVKKLKAKHPNEIQNGSDDDIQVINRVGDMEDDERFPLNGEQLKNEIKADQGKVYDEAIQEDEDDDDYNNENRNRQDPAVRA